MNKFIEIAREQALKSNMSKRYGCVLIRRNKVLSEGFNHYKPDMINYSDCLLCR